ncbi:uncharacterized protein ACA1_351330 [Acanthamoeba castellanii str. Neff]|uniref:UBX domain-containing protein n=1 Tax=Acanthamoeba castellanii (strain ATCC 30010 / Neff) TaxID=1257118 RepID=L8GDA5_ACACF|nr:uncharacterized protein ACA1_351330 [Acanthamoeba castellanii str. Neff]ELR11105.1 hypothetical protein ACA1_351330 [Acanthamoeba castellanii str. Neff]
MYAELKHQFDTKDQQQQTRSAAGRREVALVLRMANGERLPQRIFYADELLDEVRQYATLQLLERDRTAKLDFVFVCDFPRRVLSDFSRTLPTAGSTSAPSSASPMPTSPSRPLLILLRRHELWVHHTQSLLICVLYATGLEDYPSTPERSPTCLAFRVVWVVLMVLNWVWGPLALKHWRKGGFQSSRTSRAECTLRPSLACPCSRNVIRCR